jgi:hypothetical protein
LRVRHHGLMVILVAATLAGCIEDPIPQETSAGLPTVSPPSQGTALGFNPDGTAPVPKWQVGDWWEYEVSYDSGQKYTAKIVVAKEDGANYYITATERELLLRSVIDHYPTFGAVKKSGLQHRIHGDDVPFLRFPMQNQSWEEGYRDFTGQFESTFALLPTPQGTVPGFLTTMTHAGDGLVRFTHGWSPVTKYFTTFSWNFDGTGPPDVQVDLQAWGTNFTGSIPVVELTEGVHRVFQTASVSTTNPGQAPGLPTDARATFNLPPESTMLIGIFGGAGGPGDMEVHFSNQGNTIYYPWRPTGPGSFFDWGERTDASPGQWTVAAYGGAQNFAFLFVEAYAVKTTTVEL